MLGPCARIQKTTDKNMNAQQPSDTQLTPSVAIAETANRDGFFWHTHSYLNEQIRFVDTKSAYVAALATGLIGALYTAHVPDHFMKNSISTWTWAGWAAVTAFVTMIAAILMALISIAPRLRSRQLLTYIYWGGIAAHRSHEAFYKQFQSEPMDSLSEHLGQDVYILATICRDKCAWLRRALFVGIAGGLLACVVLLWAAVTIQTIPAK
jgi:hypothetical protein